MPLTEPALCYSCPHNRPKRAAVYRWTCAMSGNTVSLCIECCAYWRKIARDEAGLRPAAIHQIKAGWPPSQPAPTEKEPP